MLYYYTLATRLKDGKTVSGWVKATDLTVEPEKKVEAAPAPPSGEVRDFEITGGDPHSAKFGYFDPPGLTDPKDFVSYKVSPGISLAQDKHVAATDYLKRSDGMVNLLFNLPGRGGVSTDSFQAPDAAARAQDAPP